MYLYLLECKNHNYEGKYVLANDHYYTQEEFEKICFKCIRSDFNSSNSTAWYLIHYLIYNLINTYKFFYPKISAGISKNWWIN